VAINPRENWLRLPEFSALFAAAAVERFDGQQERAKSAGLHQRRLRAWSMYFSRGKHGTCDDTEIGSSGERGEITHISPNRFRRLMQDQLTDIVQTPPDYEPQARNTDAESQAQCSLTLGLLDSYKRDAHLEELRLERAEMGLLLGESFLHVRWDPEKGRVHAMEDVPEKDEDGNPVIDETGQPVVKQKPLYEGDFVFSVRSPYEVARAPTTADRSKAPWNVVLEPMNRWDMLEQYGGDSEDVRLAILNAPKWSSYCATWDFEKQEYDEDDTIGVYFVYGEKSRSLPEGRFALVLDEKTVLLDGPLADDRAGVFRYAPCEVMFRPEGHSNNFDGLPIAEAYHAQMSAILTNQASFGVQRIVAARKSNVKPHDLATGVSLLEYDSFDATTQQSLPEPHVAQLLAPPPEMFTFRSDLASELDTVMGGSPVRRGDPEATKGDSGAKAAMLYAAAQNISSSALRALLRSDEEVATFIVDSIRRHATVERITAIAGKNNSYTAKKFVGEDLNQIVRVRVRQANPARDTFPGRMQMAEMMLSAKSPQERQDLQSLIITGRLEPMVEDSESERILVERENEALRDPNAPMPTVRKGDQHIGHMAKHESCMTDPDLRDNSVIAARIDAHNAAHEAALTPGVPGFAGYPILAATNQKPFPPMGQSMGGGAPGLPPGGPGGPSAGNGPPPGGPRPKPPDMSGAQPGGPRMPQVPSTGERLNIQGGTPPEAPAMGG
jgi:hypothetical protein